MNSNLESIKTWLHSDKSGLNTANPHLSKNIDDFFNYIFNSSSDGVGLIDLDLNVIGVNNTMRNWYAGKRPFLGKKCYAVYHGKTEPCEDCPSLVSMQTGRMQSSIVPYESAREQFGKQVLSTFPVHNEKKEVVAVIEYVRDLTKEEKGQQAMDNLNSMLDSQSSKIMEQELALGVLGRQLSDTINNACVGIHDELQFQALPLLKTIIQKNENEELTKPINLLHEILIKMDSNAVEINGLSDRDLTSREKQIAGYIKKGLSSKEICDILCISKKTVDFHRGNLRKKLRLEEKRTDLKTYLKSAL